MAQQFGIKLNELTTETPGVVLYGVTPDDKVIPLKVDHSGVLDSTTTVPIATSGGTEALVRVAFGDIPATYGTGAQLTTTADRNQCLVRNDTNQTILVALDGATDHFKLPASQSQLFSDVTIADGATVRVRYDAVAPTSGEATISVWSDR